MEHLMLLAGLNETTQRAVTSTLSPNPNQSAHKSLLITLQGHQYLSWMMHQANLV